MIYGEKNDRLLTQYTEIVYGFRFAPFFSVYDHIAPYTGTDIHDRNTVTCNTAKYGRIRWKTTVLRSFTSVYELRIRQPGYPFQDRIRVSIFRITFVRNQIEICGFYLWKEEIKAHRNMYFKGF